MTEETDADGVPRSIGRVLDVLEAVVDAAMVDGPANLTAVALATGLTPTTALRHLRALDQRGYVERAANGSYGPGPTLLRLATVTLRHGPASSLISASRPYLDTLAATTGESSYLTVVAGTDALYLAMAESPRAIRHVGWAGRTVPLAGSAAGEALRGEPGAHVRVGAVEPDITAVAAGVRVGGAVVAALSVVGPSHRMSGATLESIRQLVVTTADDFGAHLAAHVPAGVVVTS